MKHIVLDLYGYEDLDFESKKVADEQIKIQYGKITESQRDKLSFLENGAMVINKDNAPSDQFYILGLQTQRLSTLQVVVDKLDSLDIGGLSTVFDKLTDKEPIVDLAGGEDKLSELYYELQFYNEDEDVLDLLGAEGNTTDKEFRQIVLDIWRNKESIKFNKKMDELKQFINI